MPPEAGIKIQSPVVVRSPNWLGDAVMALPAVRNLRRYLPPDARLDVAVPAKLAALWDACPFIDGILELENPKKIPAVAELLKEGNYETAFLLPNSLRVAAEAFSAGIPNTIAYPGHTRRWLISVVIEPAPYDPLRQHQKFHTIDLMEAIGADNDDACPDLEIPDDFDALELPGEGPLLVLCPGAEYGPAKRWHPERYAEVARAMQRRYGARVVIAGAGVDEAVAGEVEAQLTDAINLAGKTSLEQLMRLLVQARVVLCNDSGSMHLASALGASVVAIFGSTEPKLTGPIGPPERMRLHRYHVPCSPCFLRECPLDFACMERVTTKDVLASVRELWEAGESGVPLLPWRYRRGHFPYLLRRKAPGPKRKVYRSAF